MRSFVLGLLFISSLAQAGSGMNTSLLSQVEVITANQEFDLLLQANGITSGTSMGDIVGNGHDGDVVGNGHDGDVVGNGHGGDVVGNGGGIIEGTIQFLVQNLQSYVDQTIKHMDTSYPSVVAEALLKISRSLQFRKNPLKVIYLTREEAGTFFFDDLDQQERAAKTRFDENSPIFINIDLLYEMEDISREFLLGTLVHEVGHQVGYQSHSFLDYLGGEVVQAINLKVSSLDAITFGQGQVDVNFLNFDKNSSRAQLSIQYDDQVIYVPSWDFKTFRQTCELYWPVGVKYRNLAWKNYIDYISAPELTEVSVHGIAEVTCAGTRGETVNRFVSVVFEIKLEDNKLEVLRRYARPGADSQEVRVNRSKKQDRILPSASEQRKRLVPRLLQNMRIYMQHAVEAGREAQNQ